MAQALIAVSREPNPPGRLPLGPDGRRVIEGKLADLKRELDEWKDLQLSTTADDADPAFFEKLRGTVAGF